MKIPVSQMPRTYLTANGPVKQISAQRSADPIRLHKASLCSRMSCKPFPSRRRQGPHGLSVSFPKGTHETTRNHKHYEWKGLLVPWSSAILRIVQDDEDSAKPATRNHLEERGKSPKCHYAPPRLQTARPQIGGSIWYRAPLPRRR